MLKGDVPEAVARLKAQSGKDLLVMGSGEFVRTLMKHDLVFLYTLLLHPLVLGSGRRLFADPVQFATLELLHSQSTPTGVLIATYRPAR